jgi:hypothetical protein
LIQRLLKKLPNDKSLALIDHFVDAYSKLVIGIVSLAAPIASYLLANYIKGRKKILKKLSEQNVETSKLLTAQMAEAVKNGQNAIDFINQCQKQLKEEEFEVKKKIKILNYLEPKKRILWLFIPLFSSLALLFLDLLVRDNAFGCWYNHWLSVWLLSGSCAIFLFSMLSFTHLVFQLVDAKEILKEEELELMREEETPNIEEAKIIK